MIFAIFNKILSYKMLSFGAFLCLNLLIGELIVGIVICIAAICLRQYRNKKK